ncbi:hypothetical protein AAFF_G00088640 [Aldrovandia affinis]|uniref:Pyrin domain-containing protein n=1 Tax=Aldrovandia affinis TaxID=143900 RepID=A0AAD7WC12_9TELE|nr:hypothetical protein AAFF_G00088640 [Aldrovandia affinis]
MANVTAELVNTLDELVDDELNKFILKLSQRVEGRQHIPKGRVHGKSRDDIVEVMVEFYGKRRAVEVTLFTRGSADGLDDAPASRTPRGL